MKHLATRLLQIRCDTVSYLITPRCFLPYFMNIVLFSGFPLCVACCPCLGVHFHFGIEIADSDHIVNFDRFTSAHAICGWAFCLKEFWGSQGWGNCTLLEFLRVFVLCVYSMLQFELVSTLFGQICLLYGHQHEVLTRCEICMLLVFLY